MPEENKEATNKSVIIDLDERSLKEDGKTDSPRIAGLKKTARKVALAGAGIAATATGIGLSLDDAYKAFNQPEAHSHKPVPSIVDPLPTPDQVISLSQVVKVEPMDDEIYKKIPPINFGDFLKLSEE